MGTSPRESLAELHRNAARAGLGLVLLGLGFLLVERGLGLPEVPLLSAIAIGVYLAAAGALGLELLLVPLALRPLRPHLGALAVSVVLLAAALVTGLGAGPRGAFVWVAVRQVGFGLGLLARAGPVQQVLDALEARPTRMVVTSFLTAMLVGTALLSLPAASASGQAVPVVDALFTATSAVCVTGLIVLSTPHDWTLFGQGVILALIQIGGLGIMALSVSVVMVLGRRLRVRQRAAMIQTLDAGTAAGVRATLRYLLLLTVVFESLGWLILSLRFALDEPDPGRAAWLGLFHAVSAWNNAGFALWDDSFVAYRTDLVVNGVVSILVIAGGLGFAVLAQVLDPELLRRGMRASPRRWSVHTKLVLATTASLLVMGTLVIFFVEFNRGLAGLPPGGKLMAALFQSMSARTAGFHTVDLAGFTSLGLFFTAVLMFIGASPGSTGGGIKTSTLAVMILAVRAMVTNRENVEAFWRRIDQTTVIRAISIVFISGALVALFFGLLLAAEPDVPFEKLLFETVSAFGTVGLSTGITQGLGAPAKLLVTCLMFMGRIGPLTMALAVGDRARRTAVHYPAGRVVVG